MKDKRNNDKDGTTNPSLSQDLELSTSSTPQEGDAKPEGDIQRTRICELEKELSESKDKQLRILADLENFKKRTYKELCDARAMSRIDAILPFLKVYDHFQLAVKASDENNSFDILHKGMDMILLEFSKAFDEIGLEKIEALGAKFNPFYHEAAEERHSDDVPEGNVVEQWRCGYKIGDKVIQAALVVVSSGKQSSLNTVVEQGAEISSEKDVINE
jgi:molecular chaperone GrpE